MLPSPRGVKSFTNAGYGKTSTRAHEIVHATKRDQGIFGPEVRPNRVGKKVELDLMNPTPINEPGKSDRDGGDRSIFEIENRGREF